MLRNPIVLGQITGQYGNEGWIKLVSYTRPKEQIFDFETWYLAEESELENLRKSGSRKEIGFRWKLKSGTEKGKWLVAKPEGCESISQAEELKGLQIVVDESDFPQLDEGEYYWHDLIGLSVVNTLGTDLGMVSQLLETGANDVLVVKQEREGKVERLIPWIDQTIKEVNLVDAKIVVDWDESFE